MDLFSYNYEEKSKKNAPLADRIRPKTLDELVGQEEIVGEGKYLKRAIKEDKLFSMIFYGPPGTGKTTLARILSNHTNSNFYQLNAVIDGIKEIREVINIAKEKKSYYHENSILFIDEIHRFNKAQQDGLLHHVEDGTIILIGATTENPYFSINSPLLSRVRLFKLRLLTDSEIKKLIMRALKDEDNGLGKHDVRLDEKALKHLVRLANGDIRAALNALELSVIATMPGDNNIREITIETIEKSIQEKALYYDKAGDNHYDVISAFIKSMRGSDPDASLYWLARMIEGGEDPLFITRRMLIFASEDVGNADPRALQIALSTHQAVLELGMPEARITLAQGVIYLACTDKSNSSYIAIEKALETVRNMRQEPVPLHLKDTHYKGAKDMGHGIGYLYPHNYSDDYIDQDYVPDNIKGKNFFQPSKKGIEAYFKRCQNKGEKSGEKL